LLKCLHQLFKDLPVPLTGPHRVGLGLAQLKAALMPVLLAEKDFGLWLSGEAGLEVLKPAADDLLQRWPVSKRVNSSRAPDDDPTLIEKIALQ
jgi:hypothetical protein